MRIDLIVLFLLIQSFPRGVHPTGNGTQTTNSTKDKNKSSLSSLPIPHQLTTSESSSICHFFTNGISSFEFSSPLYPNDYPPDTDCVKIIDAGPGHAVLLQFHDYFEIETPESGGSLVRCPYDYLEIREGKFGYSPSKETICGRQPPTKLLSSGQYLWLRFHSDGTINGRGFRAIIHRIPASSPRDNHTECYYDLNKIEGVIDSLTIDQTYLEHALISEAPIDCTWIVSTEPDKKIYLQLDLYELEQPNKCEYNFIEIYRSSISLEGRSGKPNKLCGSQGVNNIKSDDNTLAIRLFSKLSKSVFEKRKFSKFRANYTIFREINVVNSSNSDESASKCMDDEFDCKDNNCISDTLYCNGRINCQLRVDEDKCPVDNKVGLKADIFIISFIGVLLVVGMCGGMILNFYRKLKQDKEEIRALKEVLRKSRESGLQSNLNYGEEGSGKNSVFSVSAPPQTPMGSSTESRETVIERTNPKSEEPIKNQASSSNEPMRASGSNEPIRALVSNEPIRALVTNEPLGGEPVSNVTYSPPIGYKKWPMKPALVKGRRASSSDVQVDFVPPQPALPSKTNSVSVPSPPPPMGWVPPQKVSVGTNSNPSKGKEVALYKKPDELLCVEVRDCACQTRESYLMSRRPFLYNSLGGRVEFSELPPRRVVRRGERDIMRFYPYRAPSSSASSEIGNSLERLDEDFN